MINLLFILLFCVNIIFKNKKITLEIFNTLRMSHSQNIYLQFKDKQKKN